IVRRNITYVFGFAYIHFFAFTKPIDHKILCSLGIVRLLFMIPCEKVHIFGKNLGKVFYFIGASFVHMGVWWDKRFCRVDAIFKDIGYSIAIFDDQITIPVTVSFHKRHLARKAYFLV